MNELEYGLLVFAYVWLVILTVMNPFLWFMAARVRAILRRPRMRRELIKRGVHPDSQMDMKIRVKRMKDGKEVL